MDPKDLSGRIAEVLDRTRTTNEAAADRLTAAGVPTSKEKVRRYREGEAERIDAVFLAAMVTEFGVSANWLLLGVGPMEPDNVVPVGEVDTRTIAQLASAILAIVPLAEQIRDIALGGTRSAAPQMEEAAPRAIDGLFVSDEVLRREEEAKRRGGG